VIETYIRPHVQYPLFSSNIFESYSNITFRESPSSESQSSSMRIDQQTEERTDMTKQITLVNKVFVSWGKFSVSDIFF